MEEQYYCLRLDDYAAPSFISADKAYFGILEDIQGLVEALSHDKKDHGLSITELIDSFRTYEAGTHDVKHHVAYQELPLLEPVKLLHKEAVSFSDYIWTHINTWGCPYPMRCNSVDAEVLWFETPEGFCRAVKAKFRNLQYQGLSGEWVPLTDGFWGFPEMLAYEDGLLFNRLTIEEKSCDLRETAEEDIADFPSKLDVDFTGFCQEIFGNG